MIHFDSDSDSDSLQNSANQPLQRLIDSFDRLWQLHDLHSPSAALPEQLLWQIQNVPVIALTEHFEWPAIPDEHQEVTLIVGCSDWP